MNQAVLLFPGEMLPYHVVDYALDWARENEGSLKVVFFLAKHPPSESYPFPNDLDQAEMLRETFDVEKGIRHILLQEIRYIEKRANARHVPVDFKIMYSPALEEIEQQSGDAEIVFIDKHAEDDADRFEGLSFNLEDLKERNARIFPVSELDRYSDVFY